MQDVDTKEVLMMAYSSLESVKETLEKGIGTYYSRSRKSLWIKGETSKNFQSLQKILLDCDNDTLLYQVKQKGVACHTGRYSCFR